VVEKLEHRHTGCGVMTAVVGARDVDGGRIGDLRHRRSARWVESGHSTLPGSIGTPGRCVPSAEARMERRSCLSDGSTVNVRLVRCGAPSRDASRPCRDGRAVTMPASGTEFEPDTGCIGFVSKIQRVRVAPHRGRISNFLHRAVGGGQVAACVYSGVPSDHLKGALPLRQSSRGNRGAANRRVGLSGRAVRHRMTRNGAIMTHRK